MNYSFIHNNFPSFIIKFKIPSKIAIKKFNNWKCHTLNPNSLSDKLYDKLISKFTKESTHFEYLRDNYKCTSVFVPFWIFDAIVKAKYVASIGYTHRTIKFNHSLNQYVDSLNNKYRYHSAEHYSKHVRDELGMQVYGGTKLVDKFVNVLKVENLNNININIFNQKFLTKNSYEVESFTLMPNLVWPTILKYINEQEIIKAKSNLKKKFKADTVKIKSMELEILAKKVEAIYFPAYIFQYYSNLTLNKAVINGYKECDVGGFKSYSFSKISLFTFINLNILNALLINFNFIPFSYIYSFLFTFPTSLTFTHWIIRSFNRNLSKLEYERVKFEKSAKMFISRNLKKEVPFNNQRVNENDSFEFYYHIFNKKLNKNNENYKEYVYKIKKEEKKKIDPLDYYKILGLDPKYSKIDDDDIATAFRTKALKSHPDLTNKYLNDKEIEIANAKFKKLLKAYKVLKDTNERKKYDSGMI